jgi:hypothetical protein
MVFVCWILSSLWIGLFLLVWSIFCLICPYLQMKLHQRFDLPIPWLKQGSSFERIVSYGVLSLNLIAFFLIWFILNFVDSSTVGFFIVEYTFPYFMLVLYWDFSRLGRMLVRREEMDCQGVS